MNMHQASLFAALAASTLLAPDPGRPIIIDSFAGGGGASPFSKEVQVSCVGNSVCPPVAKALVAANCGHLAVEAERMAA